MGCMVESNCGLATGGKLSVSDLTELAELEELDELTEPIKLNKNGHSMIRINIQTIIDLPLRLVLDRKYNLILFILSSKAPKFSN